MFSCFLTIMFIGVSIFFIYICLLYTLQKSFYKGYRINPPPSFPKPPPPPPPPPRKKSEADTIVELLNEIKEKNRG